MKWCQLLLNLHASVPAGQQNAPTHHCWLYLLLLKSLPTRHYGGEGLRVVLLAFVHRGGFLLDPPSAVLGPGFFPRLLLGQHERRYLLLPLAVLLAGISQDVEQTRTGQ